jgi:hypothetical protein
MTSEEVALAVIDVLEALAVPYMLVGSHSSNYYGIPRSTQDADFVVQLGEVPVARVAERLGPLYRLDPQMSFEMVTGTSRYILEHRENLFRIELFLLSEDPHDQERFRRRCRVRGQGRDTFVPTAEDVIITKLRWSLHARRSKDADDVRSVIAVQGDRIEWDYVHRWCDRHGTRAVLEEIRGSIPPG